MNDAELQAKMKLFEFGGRVESIIEDTFKASLRLPAKEQDEFIARLLEEYRVAGKLEKRDDWIIRKLESLFISVAGAPDWVQDIPCWPWMSGKPMIFLGQLVMPQNEETKTHSLDDLVLYVFGAKIPTPSGGWQMKYQVIEQRGSLKGLVAVVESESPPHTPANTKLKKRKTD